MRHQDDPPPSILILTGPPGAGKTAVARVLAERAERAVHLESDRFFDFIRSGFVEPWRRASAEQNEVVMRIVAGAAAGYASAGYFTIVDGIVRPAPGRIPASLTLPLVEGLRWPSWKATATASASWPGSAG